MLAFSTCKKEDSFIFFFFFAKLMIFCTFQNMILEREKRSVKSVVCVCEKMLTKWTIPRIKMVMQYCTTAWGIQGWNRTLLSSEASKILHQTTTFPLWNSWQLFSWNIMFYKVFTLWHPVTLNNLWPPPHIIEIMFKCRFQGLHHLISLTSTTQYITSPTSQVPYEIHQCFPSWDTGLQGLHSLTSDDP